MIIDAKSLSFSYSKNSKRVLDDISLSLHEGQIISILGPNGAGKSTLLNILIGLLKADSGDVFIEGKNINSLSPREIASVVSYVPQNHVPVFSYSVFNFVLMGRAPKLGMFQRPKEKDFEIVYSVLEDIGILDIADKSYMEISGGERQEATIARALVQEPKAILFDEPTAHLDFGNQIRTLRIIKKLQEKGYAVVMTTHNPDHAIMLGGTTAILDREGHLSIGDSDKIITEETLNRLYKTDLRLVKINKDIIERPICIAPDI